MTFKSILVYIDDTQASERRVRMAGEMSRRFDASLTGIYFAPPVAAVDVAELPPAEFSRRMSQREMRDRVEAAFRAAAAAAGAARADVCVVENNAVDTAIAEMRCADLAVLAQGDSESGDGGFQRKLAEEALFGAGTPILFVPYASAVSTLGEHVLIAWDGGREAARAIRDALPLLTNAKRVTVLSLGEHARLGQDSSQSQSRLVAYLRLHGVEANRRELACTSNEAGELALSQLADLGADLLVMGAYGHARVREIVLGGVTRTMLDSMTVPVLMSH